MPVSQVISQFLAVLEKGSSDSFAQDLYDCDCGGVGWGVVSSLRSRQMCRSINQGKQSPRHGLLGYGYHTQLVGEEDLAEMSKVKGSWG